MQRLAEKIRCFSRGSLPTDDMIPANRGISMASLDHFVAEVSEETDNSESEDGEDGEDGEDVTDARLECLGIVYGRTILDPQSSNWRV